MKATCVIPGMPNSVHVRDVPEPGVTDIPNGRGLLVKALRVGVDGTDKEINLRHGYLTEYYVDCVEIIRTLPQIVICS